MMLKQLLKLDIAEITLLISNAVSYNILEIRSNLFS